MSGAVGRLRRWRPDDAEMLARAWNDDEVARWNSVPADRSVEAARQWIEAVIRRPSDSAGVDLVVVDDDDVVVGEIGLQIAADRGVAELGFWVDADRRREGWGRTMLDLASAEADRRGLRGLIAVSDARNDGAAALFERAGWLEVHAGAGRRAWVDRRI